MLLGVIISKNMFIEDPVSSGFRALIDAIADRVVEKLKIQGFIKRKAEVLTFQDGTSIDLCSVTMIDILRGDPDWLSYKIMLMGGHIVEIFESRRYAEGNALPQMPRAEFIRRMSWYDAIAVSK